MASHVIRQEVGLLNSSMRVNDILQELNPTKSKLLDKYYPLLAILITHPCPATSFTFLGVHDHLLRKVRYGPNETWLTKSAHFQLSEFWPHLYGSFNLPRIVRGICGKESGDQSNLWLLSSLFCHRIVCRIE